MTLRSCVSMCFLALGFAEASAQIPLWQPDGVAVCGEPCRADIPFAVSDGQGGVYVAWRDSRTEPLTGTDVYLQRLSSSGQVAPGWPETGIPICTVAGSQTLTGLSPDGFGGALIVWQDFRDGVDIYCQRVLPDGSIAPGWEINGTAACDWPGQQGNCSSIVGDGSGGAYIVWDDLRLSGQDEEQDVFAQHLTADGQIAPGWIEGGLPISVAPSFQGIFRGPENIASDGAGGVLIVWTDCRSGVCESYGIRLLSDGSPAPGWQSSGNILFEGIQGPRILPDGAGGFYVTSAVNGEFGLEDDLFVKRFTMDGELLPGWPSEGVQVCCTGLGRAGRPKLVRDGLGGLIFERTDNSTVGRDVFGFRVNPDGTLPAGWPIDGIRINDPGIGSNAGWGIASDGEGGAFFTRESDTSEGTTAWIQHIAESGLPEESWPQYGVRVTSTRSQFTPVVADDGSEGAIVVWEELGGTGSRRGLFAQRFVDDDVVQTKLSLVVSKVADGIVTLQWHEFGISTLGKRVYRRTDSSTWEALGTPHLLSGDRIGFDDPQVIPGQRYAYRLGYLDGGTERFTTETWLTIPTDELYLAGFRPNPARGVPQIQFTLPTAQPALLEVVDVRGRMVYREDVGALGPGGHTVDLTSQSQLLPGVYWIRLTQAGRVLTARGVVLR